MQLTGDMRRIRGGSRILRGCTTKEPLILQGCTIKEWRRRLVTFFFFFFFFFLQNTSCIKKPQVISGMGGGGGGVAYPLHPPPDSLLGTSKSNKKRARWDRLTPTRCGQHMTQAHNHFTRSISSPTSSLQIVIQTEEVSHFSWVLIREAFELISIPIEVGPLALEKSALNHWFNSNLPGEQRWSSGGEGARLPAPMWPGFHSRIDVTCELILLVLCSDLLCSAQRACSPGTPVIPFPQKPTYNFIWDTLISTLAKELTHKRKLTKTSTSGEHWMWVGSNEVISIFINHSINNITKND